MKKLKVLVFQTGEALHIDWESTRPMRAMNLSNFLLERGHQVHVISSKFYHQKKIHRQLYESNISDDFKITLIDSPGYKKNISLSRLFDHFILSLNLHRYIGSNKFPLPDVAIIGFPPIECAFVLARFFKFRDIPFIIDVKDQWPDYFLNALPDKAHPIGRLFLFPYYLLTKFAFSNAKIITSVSTSFLSWSKRHSASLNKSFLEFPLSSKKFSESYDLPEMYLWWKSYGVDLNKKNCISFVGSLSQAFDFEIVRWLAEYSLRDGLDILFVICGDGEELADLKLRMCDLTNVIFTGWIGEGQIASLMSSTIATLAPYKNQKNFTDNIPNKIIDSLSFGIPIITTLSGEVGKLIETYQIGLIFKGNFDDFYKNFLILVRDDIFVRNLSENALNLYNQKFRYEIVYAKFCDAIEGITD